MAQRETNWVGLVQTIALVYGVVTVAGMFKGRDEKPGGENVPPAPPDDRPATFTEIEAKAIADQLETAIWGSWLITRPWEYDGQIAALLMMAQVSRDVQLLMNAYGYRGQALTPESLSQSIANYLDGDYKAVVNDDYMKKNIQFQWA